jgi:hypothetical protein
MDCKLKEVYLILHSVELLVPLFFLAVFTKSAWALGISVGLALHLVSDYTGNSIQHPATYFFLYRWSHDFHFDKAFDRERTLKNKWVR